MEKRGKKYLKKDTLIPFRQDWWFNKIWMTLKTCSILAIMWLYPFIAAFRYHWISCGYV